MHASDFASLTKQVRDRAVAQKRKAQEEAGAADEEGGGTSGAMLEGGLPSAS